MELIHGYVVQGCIEHLPHVSHRLQNLTPSAVIDNRPSMSSTCWRFLCDVLLWYLMEFGNDCSASLHTAFSAGVLLLIDLFCLCLYSISS